MKKLFFSVLYLLTVLICIVFISCEQPNVKEDSISVQYAIKLESPEHALFLGSKYPIKAKIMPKNYNDDDFVWTSSNKRIATVDEHGIVSCISSGKATISLTVGNSSKKISIYVKDVFDNFTYTDSSGSPSGAWMVDANNAYEGADALKSYSITHSKETSASITIPAGYTNVSFYAKVSSEPTFDYLEFKINGSSQLMGGVNNISGTKDWTYYTYSLPPNQNNTLTWTYHKDSSDSAGSDCGWISSISCW